MTSDMDRYLLLQLARQAMTAHVHHQPMPAIELAGVFARPGGAFVTLHRRGDLRGCIGHTEPNEPLGEVVARCAVAACSRDPRFPPVTESELGEIELELSLLGPLEPITRLEDIEIGTHGLVVEQGWHRGLLLPQVATEWKWDRETFLAHTCQKAGLPMDAWKKGAKLWRFSAEVFGEEKKAG
jgi:AmmeMemoRadiSam system protein A